MLTQKQKIFIKEYLLDHNATAAAKRSGYSPKNADKIGAQLLGKTRVSEAINTEFAARMKKLEIKSENILKELSKIAFFDIVEILDFTSDGDFTVKPIRLWSEAARACIKSISSGKNGPNIQFYNKVDALEMLGAHLRMWNKPGEESQEEQAQKRSDMLERIKKIIQERAFKEKQSTSE